MFFEKKKAGLFANKLRWPFARVANHGGRFQLHLLDPNGARFGEDVQRHAALESGSDVAAVLRLLADWEKKDFARLANINQYHRQVVELDLAFQCLEFLL